MDTTLHKVDLRYERREIVALFETARREDVESGGRYDHGGGAITVWTHHWQTPATRYDSTIIGTLYIYWADENRIYEIECDQGFSLDDLLHELAILEEKALGRIKHGSRTDTPH
jgi:hypothetical protein